MEPPPIKQTGRAREHTKILSFYEVLTDGQQYDAARLEPDRVEYPEKHRRKIHRSVHRIQRIRIGPFLRGDFDERGLGRHQAEIRGRDSKRTGNRCASGRFFGRFPERAGAKRPKRPTDASSRPTRTTKRYWAVSRDRFPAFIPFTNKAADIISTMLSRTVPTACRSWKFGRGTAPKHIMRRIPRMNST